MQPAYCIVMTTVSDAEVGKRIIDALLAGRLAACVQVLPITSYYTWKGAVSTDAENLLLIKTRAALYAQVEACIKAQHSYDVPEIVQVPITAGSAAYLGWIDDVTLES
ncbi:MAG: divalent-cation tolerance protein CutA [Anaerolineae bacterium]|nr:divalent-cation tolerance protein CutA [Anaerolineae bacterium]